MMLHAATARLPSADTWNAATAVSLLIIAAAYLAGVRRLWRTDGGRQTVRRWQAAAFLGGCGSAAAALLSPLDGWSDILFSAHMAQHEVLMLVSAPLMVMGRPFVATLWAFAPTTRSEVAGMLKEPWLAAAWERLSRPLTVLILHALVLWGWHVPALFEAALHDETIHAIQHLGFFLTAALFWWTLIHGRYGRLGYGVGVLYVFATAMHAEILGALLTFARPTLYPTHAGRTLAAGLDPIADQQLAGIVMWVPFGAVFVVIALALFGAWLGEASRRSELRL
jgi:putative membrane protein